MTGQILIVDDEAAIRRLVHGAVERAGYSASEAATGAEALTAARNRHLPASRTRRDSTP